MSPGDFSHPAGRYPSGADGGRAQLTSDARRYDLLTVHGWLVLGFAHEHLMTQPDFVRRVLVAAVSRAEVTNQRCRCRHCAA